MLSLARLRSCSKLHSEWATPMTGTLSTPRLVIAYSAGKICWCAKSPLAPKNTSASDDAPSLFGSISAGFLVVSPELLAHGGEQTISVVGVAPGFEAGKQRSTDHRR